MPDPQFDVRAFGPLEVIVEGRPRSLGGPRQRAVMSRLLLEPGVAVTSAALADAIWGDRAPPTAERTIQTYISRLRAILGPVIDHRGRHYSTAVEPGSVDVHRFLDAAAPDPDTPPGTRRARLHSALALWRGEPWVDLETRISAAHLLRQRRDDVVEELAGLELSIEGPVELAGLSNLVAEQPLRESAWALLAAAFYRADRQAEALDVLHRARRTLAELAGLSPGATLVATEQAVLLQRPWEVAVGAALGRAATGHVVPGAPRRALPAAQAVLSDLPLAGRCTELARLHEAWDRIEACGTGEVVVVGGLAGMGKSRLVSEFARTACDHGAIVLFGSSEPEDHSPFGALGRAIRGVARDDPAVAGPLLGELGPQERFLLDLGAAVEADGDGDGAGNGTTTAPHRGPRVGTRLADRLADGLRELARTAPVLLTVEDVHWAQRSEATLLVDLLRQGRLGAMLVVVTHRLEPMDATVAGAALIERLRRLSVVPPVDLDPLGDPDAHRLASSVAPDLSVEARLRVVAASEGHPLLVRSLADHAGRGGDLAAVPDRITRLVRDRLSALDPPVRAMVELLAADGRRSRVAVLSRCGASPDDVVEHLDQAIASGLVHLVEQDSGTYGFRHQVLRDAIRADVPPGRAYRNHARLARAYQDLVPERPWLAARHLVLSGPLGGADCVEWCRRGRAALTERLALEQAATMAGWAVRAHRRGHAEPDRRLCDLLVEHADALCRADDPRAAEVMAEARRQRAGLRVGHPGR